jgi:serine/threonine-protein kinase
VLDLETDSLTPIIPNAVGAWYVPTGHILYTARDGGLFVIGFDASRMETTSGAVPVIANVEPGSFVYSDGGDAIYSLNAAELGGSELVWVDRGGREAPLDSTWRARFEYPALSPDGRTVAVSVRGEITDLWLRRPDGRRQKILAPGSANWRANFTADGDTIYFVSVGSEGGDDVVIRKVRADLGSEPALFMRGRWGIWETEVSRDGKWMVIRSDDEDSNSNLWYRGLSGDTALKPANVDKSQTTQIALSPDARWLAYTTNDDSGIRYNMYIAPFPAMAPRRLVSRGGGTEPRWSRSGRELFFKSEGRLVVASIGAGATLDVGDPRPLFSLEGYRGARNRQQYDVAPDGRFLMIKDPQAGAASPVVYAHGFLGQLREVLR